MKTLNCLLLLSAATWNVCAQTNPNAASPAAKAHLQTTHKSATQSVRSTKPAPVQKTSTTRPVALKSPHAQNRPGHITAIPAEAVKAADGNYHYKDSSGKAWVYRQTPFGITRAPEGGVAPAAVASAGPGNTRTPFGVTKTSAAPAPPIAHSASQDAQVTAKAQGDLIVFRRATPFGSSSWQKNKNELNEDEQKIWARQQSKGNQ